MTYIMLCKSCENNQKCKLKDDENFIDLCPINKSKRIIKPDQKTDQDIIYNQQFDIIKSSPTKKKQESEKESESEKRRILRDIEKGRGGPDIAGMKKMHGTPIESKLAKKAKERLLNSF